MNDDRTRDRPLRERCVVCHGSAMVTAGWLRQWFVAPAVVAACAAAARADVLVAPVTSQSASQQHANTAVHADPRVAWWPFSPPRRLPIYDSAGGPVTAHPAVARIIVPEGHATAYGSGTLVGVHENHGLVVTNWHVVQD